MDVPKDPVEFANKFIVSGRQTGKASVMGVDFGGKSDRWSHATMTYDKEKGAKLYLNGVRYIENIEIFGLALVEDSPFSISYWFRTKKKTLEQRYFDDLEDWEKNGDIPTLIDGDCTKERKLYEKSIRELKKFRDGKVSKITW